MYDVLPSVDGAASGGMLANSSAAASKETVIDYVTLDDVAKFKHMRYAP